MYILMKDLCKKINKYPKVLIYGAGYYANVIYQALKKVGLRDKVDSFFVTNLEGTEYIDGITIKEASALASYSEKESIILISVNRIDEKEIIRTVKESYGFENEIKLLDYIMEDNVLYEKLKTESDEWFFQHIMEYYVWNYISPFNEFGNKWKEIESNIKLREQMNPNQNVIVFISGDLKPRSEKIIGALVRKNYHIVVLEYGFCNELVRTEVMLYNIEFFHCRDMIEVFYRALQYKPLVYYFEPVWGDCSVSEIMIRHKNLFGKVAFAAYDVLNDGYVQIPEKDKLTERYCLENADGIVWRWFSKEFLEEKKGFVYKGKSIQFLDYCKGVDVKRDNKSDDRLKICFVQGGIYQFLDDTVFTNNTIYTEPARIDTILDKIGNNNDCIFHLFIGRCDDNDRKKLRKLEEKYFNFKVFYETSHSELIYKISEYDYGCFFMTNGKDIPEQESIDNVYYGSIHINSITNRFFDYLDAGIPIISTIPKKLCEHLESYGVIIKMNVSDINIEYLKQHKLIYAKNVAHAQTDFKIDNHIQRLIDFFNAI